MWYRFGQPIFTQRQEVGIAGPEGDPESRDESIAAGVVALSADQIAAAQLHVATITRQMLQEIRQIPGRIGYNENLYLPITSPVQGVVREVKVLPGQEVRRGDLLAVISSAEIGSAHSELLMKEEELELAAQQFQWEDQILQNINRLLELLTEHPDMATIEKEFQAKLLGDHRDDILAAYSRLKLAESTSSRTDPLAERGVVSGRIVQQRQSEREVAAANFQSMCEETRMRCAEQRNRALAVLNDARRRLAVSREQLSALCGAEFEEIGKTSDGSLNDLYLRAPLAGQITRKDVVPATRVEVADSLFVLANTDSLWVAAQLREKDWETLRSVPGQSVELRIPAVAEREFAATIRFVGAEVSEQTRALPLVAELENVDGLLKPGLFAWVSVPVGEARHRVVVPVSSLVRHEGQTFVFVEEQPGRYRRQDVTVGLETPEWIEIQSGIKEGDQVVDQGAFCLKSELLLSGEE